MRKQAVQYGNKSLNLLCVGDAGTDALKKSGSGLSIERVTTRSWAETHNYNPVKLFTKVSRSFYTILVSLQLAV